MLRAAVWNEAFAEGDEHRSWYEQHPAASLRAIERVVPPGPAPIIDAGGGSSRLCGALLAAGYTDVTVLDISQTALELARRRLWSESRADHLDCGRLAPMAATVPVRRLA